MRRLMLQHVALMVASMGIAKAICDADDAPEEPRTDQSKPKPKVRGRNPHVVRLDDRPLAPKEKSASLKKMLSRKGRS